MPEAALKRDPAVRQAWTAFVDAIEPLRPDLFRFGLRLTGNPFDAEDLVHDGMLRAFGTLELSDQDIRSPRAFLFRILTNLWIDELRRARPESSGAAAATALTRDVQLDVAVGGKPQSLAGPSTAYASFIEALE